ncbi:MAG: diguanylate cyclase, partial [Erysipelotrichaceae bacterium]|nr:diguanylate cyclase [Erysipelotrichaceae bacterium]
FNQQISNVDVCDNLPLSIVFGDVNGLKLTNDVYGHDQGDLLLRSIAEVMVLNSREGDIVCRMSGDEFIALLPKTDFRQAKQYMKNVKNCIRQKKTCAIKFDIALGASTKINENDDIFNVIKLAEDQMYESKAVNRRDFSTQQFNSMLEYLYGKSKREKRHAENVSKLCALIGAELNMSENDIDSLRKAGLYHDIGKIIFSDDLFYKVGSMTDDELEIVKKHPLIGYRILSLFDKTIGLANSVLEHHENWDGTGYPKGLAGNKINLFSRIISVAEVFDSITHPVNGDSRNKEVALKEIKLLSSLKFDPVIVNAFIKVMENNS